MQSNLVIDQTNWLDFQLLSDLVIESELEGFRFLKRLEAEYFSGENRFDNVGEMFLIAKINGVVVGVCGLNQDPYTNDKRIGRVRRLYVARDFRRLGIGRMLTRAIIHEAKRHYDFLVLHTDNKEAERFYESFGFVRSEFFQQSNFYLHLV